MTNLSPFFEFVLLLVVPRRFDVTGGQSRYEHDRVHAAFRGPCRLCQEDATVRTSDDPAADMRG
jgi:hypothetical protein